MLRRDEVCPGAGYLCASIARGEEVRIVRWNDDTGLLRIRVPAPAHEPAARARALQRAAARGLRAWQGRPFPLRIDLSEIAGDHDVVIRWVDTLTDRGLGRTRTRWTFQNGRGDVEVEDVVLATRTPGSGRDVTPDALELAAAHEMGHVLGLPHSDRERDVMYPENTATRPTSRDYRTLEALYGLANGAVVR